MATKKKKESCSVCNDKGFVEYEHGLIQKLCPERCPTAIAILDRLHPPGKPGIPYINIAGDFEPLGSTEGETTGDTQSTGEEGGAQVLKGNEFVLPSARKKHTV